MAALLAKVRGLIFYDTKCNLANRVLNATAKRKPDQAAPEITLDPLEVIGGKIKMFEKKMLSFSNPCTCIFKGTV